MTGGEKSLHQQFEAWLRKHGIPWSHDRMDKKTSAKDADPDFRCYRTGRVAFVEFKHGKNKLSAAQVSRIEELKAAGCHVCVAYDLETAIQHVQTALGIENDVQEPPEAQKQALSEGGDAPCPCTSTETMLGCSSADQQFKPLVCAGVPIATSANFRIAKILGTDWVIAPDVDGVWDRIRRASALDIANFKRVNP